VKDRFFFSSCRWVCSLLVISLLVTATGCGGSNVFQGREQKKKDDAKAEAIKKRKKGERLAQQQRQLQEEALRGTNARPGR
jgi:hypothetical protein